MIERNFDMAISPAEFVWGISPGGQIAYVNKVSRGLALQGITVENILGAPIWEFAQSEEMAERLRHAFSDTLLTGERQSVEIVATSGECFVTQFFRVKQVIGVIAFACSVPAAERRLTSREYEIINLMCRDLTNVKIATFLGISISTVDTHKAHIREKLGVKTNNGIILFAVRAGLAED